MRRTTIMADEEVLRTLQDIARREGRSLADVIREALRLRIERPARRLHFLGIGASRPGSGPTARESADLRPEPPPWR